MGKWKNNIEKGDVKFHIDSHLNKTPVVLSKAIELLQSDHGFEVGEIKQYINKVAEKSMKLLALKDYRFPGRDEDQLFKVNYPHVDREDCSTCNVKEIEKRLYYHDNPGSMEERS
jgi:hypothetical protein